MVGDLLIIDIARGGDLFIGFPGQNLLHETARIVKSRKSADIFIDFLGHCRGKDSGIGSRVSHQLFFVELLDDFQRLVRTDFQISGTLILKLREVIEKRWIFCLPFLFHALQNCLQGLIFLQNTDQFLRILLFLETIFLVKLRGLVPVRALNCPKFSRKLLSIAEALCSYHAVEGRFHEIPDLPFPADHHAQHAGHNPAHGDHGITRSQII